MAFFCLLKPKASLATNWYCPNSTAYYNCYVSGFCGDCVDYDSLPSCVGSTNCNCKPTGLECGSGGQDVCEGAAGGWNYKYSAKCVREKPDPQTGECSAKWYWKYNNCNAGDRCEDPSVGNTAGACGGTVDAGSNSSGHILAGQCAAGACPSVGCRNGGWYKTCCKYNDYGAGGPSVGDTLTGQISSCANCRYTDCCSGDGGVCVWGTSCTAGAALSSQNFCWHLGSAPSPTSGPTPTPGPTDAPPEGGTGSAMHIKIREDKCSSKNKCVVGETINIKVCQKPKRCFEKSCFYNKINVYTVRQPAGVASGTVLCTAEGFSSKPHCNSCDFLNNDFNTGQDDSCDWNTTGFPPGQYTLGVYYGGHSDAFCKDGAASAQATFTLLSQAVPTSTPTPCPAQYDFTESNQSAINSYCVAAGYSCSAPNVWASLSCHRAVTGWFPFGSACINPYCTGCACLTPTPTPCPSISAPTGLTCNVASNSISWNAVAGADHYALRVDANPSSWSGACPATSPDYCGDVYATSRSYSFSAGTSYSVWVHSLNSCGSWSSPTYTSCSGPTPTQVSCPSPSNFTASDGVYGDRVYLWWTALPGATGYKVYRNNVDCTTLTGASTASYTDTGVSSCRGITPNVKYTYKLTAYFGSTKCPDVTDIGWADLCPSSALPAAPSNMAFAGTEIGWASCDIGGGKQYANPFNILWKDNTTNEKGFKIYLDDVLIATTGCWSSGSCGNTSIVPDPSNPNYLWPSYNNYSLAGACNVGCHTIKVSSYCQNVDGNNERESAKITKVVCSSSGGSVSPSVAWSAGGVGPATISWNYTPPTGVYGTLFDVYRCNTDSAKPGSLCNPCSSVLASGVSGNSYVDNTAGITSENRCYYVRAYTSVCPAPCTTVTPTPTCAPVCSDPPVLSKPALGTILGVDSVTLTWKAPGSWGKVCPPEVTDKHYVVYVSKTGDSDLTDNSDLVVNQRVEAGTTSYTVTGLNKDITYYWQVRANNGH